MLKATALFSADCQSRLQILQLTFLAPALFARVARLAERSPGP